jgi:hypothetical protein
MGCTYIRYGAVPHCTCTMGFGRSAFRMGRRTMRTRVGEDDAESEQRMRIEKESEGASNECDARCAESEDGSNGHGQGQRIHHIPMNIEGGHVCPTS